MRLKTSAHQNPTLLRVNDLQVCQVRISLLELLCLTLQDAREHQHTTRAHEATQQGRQHFQRAGQDIGKNTIEGALGQVGQAHLDDGCDAVVKCILTGGIDGGWVDIDRLDKLGTIKRCRNGQDA